MKTFSRSLGVAALFVTVALSPGLASAEVNCAECDARTREAAATEFQRRVERLAAAVPAEISECTDRTMNLRTVRVGFRCRTSKGAIYERVARDNFGEAWKGPDGLIWGDLVAEYTQQAAAAACTDLGGELPSCDDFARGEANGFREVLPHMKGYWYWSSSHEPTPSITFHACYFGGTTGSFFYHDIRDPGPFRCAGR